MIKQKSTKSALIVSALALLVCVTMLIGSTFAWFTDSVTSAGNIIKSGTLEVSMDWAAGTEDPSAANWQDASKGAIFNNDKWEPGYVEARHVKITNDGTLALKYQIKIVANGLVSELAEVIDVYYADPAVQIAGRDAIPAASKLGTLDVVLDGIDTSAAGELLAGESHTVTIALKMQEAAGNEYQGKAIGTDFSIQLIATQNTVENDSFDNKYDNSAAYPLVASGKKALNEELVLPYNESNVEIVVPKEAHEGNYSKVVTYESLTEENGEWTYATDFCAELNGQKVTPVAGVEYKVSLKLAPFVNIKQVIHNGNLIPLSECEYDAFTGIVSFYTDSFSPFEVIYEEVAENPSSEGRKITGGIFTVDPVVFDASLANADNEYICVPYVKNSTAYYAVSERATTVILDDGNAADYLENKDEAYFGSTLKKNSSGKLYSIISSLQNNEFSTVYLLPGTYNEATTIYIYSSMNIVGIGDTDSVKVVKGSSSSSNRHLFNANGTKADYINVTLENLYLDATAKTTNSKDNAAVQSIRKSKVKCYDLTVVKGSGWDAVAFYVNGNNAVDGVKYPAYMYVENCTLNTTRAFGVVTTSGSYKFYHKGLTYGGTLYTTDSTSIKNQAMDYDDWDW
ncbi:MAG: SipW-dependent-type signal peptide-containing protein [Clostridia bacterium]|nr:SipW-dependent-type signal peptide-containing protein [Clostridia bacterium]